jgi:hypothetical protein
MMTKQLQEITLIKMKRLKPNREIADLADLCVCLCVFLTDLCLRLCVCVCLCPFKDLTKTYSPTLPLWFDHHPLGPPQLQATTRRVTKDTDNTTATKGFTIIFVCEDNTFILNGRDSRAGHRVPDRPSPEKRQCKTRLGENKTRQENHQTRQDQDKTRQNKTKTKTKTSQDKTRQDKTR